MIGSSKNNIENYPTKCFWTPEKETRVKFNPGLSANRLSNNWALVLILHFFCRFVWFPIIQTLLSPWRKLKRVYCIRYWSEVVNTVRVGLNKAWIADEVIFKKCQMFLKQPKRFGFTSLRQCGENRFTVLQGFPILQSLSVIACKLL